MKQTYRQEKGLNMRFHFRDTIEGNLNNCHLDANDNLISHGEVIIKQLPKGELLEHLGYFHNLSKKLKLPYNPILEIFEKHRKQLIKKNKGE